MTDGAGGFDRSIFPALLVVGESQLFQRPLFVECNPRNGLISIGSVGGSSILFDNLPKSILVSASTERLWKTRKRRK